MIGCAPCTRGAFYLVSKFLQHHLVCLGADVLTCNAEVLTEPQRCAARIADGVFEDPSRRQASKRDEEALEDLVVVVPQKAAHQSSDLLQFLFQPLRCREVCDPSGHKVADAIELGAVEDDLEPMREPILVRCSVWW